MSQRYHADNAGSSHEGRESGIEKGKDRNASPKRVGIKWHVEEECGKRKRGNECGENCDSNDRVFQRQCEVTPACRMGDRLVPAVCEVTGNSSDRWRVPDLGHEEKRDKTRHEKQTS